MGLRGLRWSILPAASTFLVASWATVGWAMECRVDLVGHRSIQGAQDKRDCWAARKSPAAGDQECRVASKVVWTVCPLSQGSEELTYSPCRCELATVLLRPIHLFSPSSLTPVLR